MPDYPALNYNPQPGIDYTQLVQPGTTNYTGAALAAGPSFMDNYGGAIASGIGALGSLGGAWMQSRAANAATAASAKSNAEALAYQRQKYAMNQANYDAWNRMRAALLQRYGVDLAPSSAAPVTIGQMVQGV